MGLFEFIAKSRSGVYKDTSENRRLHRVGQKYGGQKQLEDEGELIPGMPNSTKVNLKKYLSDKVKEQVEEYIANVSTLKGLWNKSEGLDAIIDQIQHHFNKNFDSIPKAQRAFYVAVVKCLLERKEELRTGEKKDVSTMTETEEFAIKQQNARLERAKRQQADFELLAKTYGIERGAPMSIDLADSEHANPRYCTLVDGSFRPYTSNCQTCVVAYELRKRGYDVEAIGVAVKKGEYSNGFQQSIARDSTFSFEEDVDPVKLNGGIKSNTDKGRRQFLENICNVTKESGTYFFSFKNKGRFSAHIVVLERLSDKLLLVDPQANIKKNLLEPIEYTRYFKSIDIVSEHNQVFRVNDLTFKPEVFSIVKKADIKLDNND